MKGLPEDTEITHCWFCREWHGVEKFCFGTLHVHMRHAWRAAKSRLESMLEILAWSVGVLALLAFAIALGIALGGWLLHLIR